MESDEEQDRKVPAMTTKNNERTAAEDDKLRRFNPRMWLQKQQHTKDGGKTWHFDERDIRDADKKRC